MAGGVVIKLRSVKFCFLECKVLTLPAFTDGKVNEEPDGELRNLLLVISQEFHCQIKGQIARDVGQMSNFQTALHRIYRIELRLF